MSSRAEPQAASSPGAPDVLEQIRELACQSLDHNGPLEPQMRLVEDLQLDSIRLLTLAVEVEDHFRICLDEEDEASLTTVGELVTLVESKLARA